MFFWYWNDAFYSCCGFRKRNYSGSIQSIENVFTLSQKTPASCLAIFHLTEHWTPEARN